MNTTKLRELLSKATPRPWEERFIYRQLSLYSQSCFNPSIQKAWDDAALIVALVNNAEALLNEVERLRGALIFIRDKEEAALNEAESLRFNIPDEAGCMEILHAARAALEQQK